MTQFRTSEKTNCTTKYVLGDNLEFGEILNNFLLQHPQHHQPQIISFSQKINRVNVLDLLAAIRKPNQLYLYWENPRHLEAMLGYGSIKSFKIDSKNRFREAKDFVKNCLQQTIKLGDLQLPGSGPHFCCSFSFFSQISKDYAFNNTTIFLPELQIYCQDSSCVLVVNTDLKNFNKIPKKIAEINQKIANLNKSKLVNQSKKINSPKIQENSQQFQKAVKSALVSIENKKFSKIVLAHPVDIINSQPFDVIASLDNLRNFHPDCYTFALSDGQDNYFIGASPERLITINKRQLITDALAGTAPRGKTPQKDALISQALINSEKERREHQTVTEFINKSLQELGLKPEIMPLKLLKLANIQHLWTPIYAQLPKDLHPLEIVDKLHPTPAVAGVPTEVACTEIRYYESFERGLYAAPLGWIDYQGNSKFIVGIRSALIRGNHGRLYGGAGIVAGSVPEKEYAEVKLKIQSLLKALV